jgi:hypothetical protein
MTAVQNEPSRLVREQRRRSLDVLVPEMWASLAIIVMWVSVLVVAIVGPDIVTSDAGGTHSTVPAAVAVALFAFLGTWVVARYGFRRPPKD